MEGDNTRFEANDRTKVIDATVLLGELAVEREANLCPCCKTAHPLTTMVCGTSLGGVNRAPRLDVNAPFMDPRSVIPPCSFL